VDGRTVVDGISPANLAIFCLLVCANARYLTGKAKDLTAVRWGAESDYRSDEAMHSMNSINNSNDRLHSNHRLTFEKPR
jgi:hypothetical protein